MPQLQERLAQADAVWKLALEATGDGVWDWDIAQGREVYSANMLALYGYDVQDAQATPDFFDALTHPDDRAQMEADRRAHFEGRSPAYRNEHRVRCKDGSYKWILTRGMVIERDSAGRPLRMVGTHTDITERKATEVLAWKQANYDALTGLPNRRLLNDRLQLALKKQQRNGQGLALLMVDLDHFKAVNDRLGHDVGDQLLMEAALRLRACVREVDLVARHGGDEFIVLLEALGPGAEVVERVAGQIVRRLAEPFDCLKERGKTLPVSASIGIALCPIDASDEAALLKRADQALYVAKQTGRQRFHHYTATLQQAADARTQLGRELRRALEQGQFRLRLLPLQRGDDQGPPRAEVQLRWQHPGLGELGPASFMPGAESSGLVHELGDWLLTEAARWLCRWRAMLAPQLGLSVSVAGSQLRQWGQSVPDWTAHLLRLGLGGGGLTLDVSEAQLTDPHTLALLHLPALRAAGISLALDGFGGGPSNLAALRHPGLSAVKLSRSLTAATPAQGADADWLRALCALAHARGLEVVARNVTPGAHALALQALGIDAWMGDAASAALTPDAFEDWLRQR